MTITHIICKKRGYFLVVVFIVQILCCAIHHQIINLNFIFFLNQSIIVNNIYCYAAIAEPFTTLQ